MNTKFLILIFAIFTFVIIVIICNNKCADKTSHMTNTIEIFPDKPIESQNTIESFAVEDIPPEITMQFEPKKTPEIIISDDISAPETVSAPKNDRMLKFSTGEWFKDSNYKRDIGLTKAMDKFKNKALEDYNKPATSFSNFNIPVDSNDKIIYKQYDDIVKSGESMYIHDIYDKMCAQVDEKISQEEIERITGKPIEIEKLTTNLYKPLYVSMEPDILGDIIKTVPYIYTPYTKNPIGCML